MILTVCKAINKHPTRLLLTFSSKPTLKKVEKTLASHFIISTIAGAAEAGTMSRFYTQRFKQSSRAKVEGEINLLKVEH